jgi:hypothetical protein
MQHVWERGEMHTKFRWGNMRERDYVEDPGIDGSVISNGSSGSGMGGMHWICLA